MVTLLANKLFISKYSFTFNLFRSSLPLYNDIFKCYTNMSRSLVTLFLKNFRRTSVKRVFLPKTRRSKFRKLFAFFKPKRLIRLARFNFFQFFFLKKHNSFCDMFFKVFEKAAPSSILYFFLRTNSFESSFFLKFFFPSNLDRFEDNSFFFKRRYSPFRPELSCFRTVSCTHFLFFPLKRHRQKKLRHLFFLMKKHFFFKNVSKKTSFYKSTDTALFPFFMKMVCFAVDNRTNSVLFWSNSRNHHHYHHPLNWGVFDQYNWQRRI